MSRSKKCKGRGVWAYQQPLGARPLRVNELMTIRRFPVDDIDDFVKALSPLRNQGE